MATDFQFSFAYNNYLVEKRKHYTPEQEILFIFRSQHLLETFKYTELI